MVRRCVQMASSVFQMLVDNCQKAGKGLVTTTPFADHIARLLQDNHGSGLAGLVGWWAHAMRTLPHFDAGQLFAGCSLCCDKKPGTVQTKFESHDLSSFSLVLYAPARSPENRNCLPSTFFSAVTSFFEGRSMKIVINIDELRGQTWDETCDPTILLAAQRHGREHA
ncbi:hypothetical protein K491DRAFT_678750 [Lophiostoma macrostomum CBS 122681]|uniref:Uncharacterized protein n=1 Tax=Lophiostoma macrostomum CBS 122681 TaxID=1314788 RepID=A0A6A6T9K1_9PLEO|nr:hypothetical protein K491DRAFT_678750 [Lophiostoma macrostomum CBS 122681]